LVDAPHDGALQSADGGTLDAARQILTMASVLYDGVIVASGDDAAQALSGHGEAVHYAAEAFKHAKAVAALGAGIAVLRAAMLPGVRLAGDGDADVVSDAGVVTLASAAAANGDGLQAFASTFADALAAHRHFDRELAGVAA
jgi:catalase